MVRIQSEAGFERPMKGEDEIVETYPDAAHAVRALLARLEG